MWEEGGRQRWYCVAPVSRQLEREVCTAMHAQLAFGTSSRIRENGREAAREGGVAEGESCRRCLYLEHLLDRAYTCPVRLPLPDRPPVSARAAVLTDISRTRRDARHQVAEDDVAGPARAVLRTDEPRGAKPPRLEDHRAPP
jgi:hypothetical protein